MLREKLYFEDVVYRLESLMVYTKIREDEVIQLFKEVSAIIAYDTALKGANEKYYQFAAKLVNKAEELGFSGHLLRKYAMYLFAEDENVFSIGCEKKLDVKKSGLYAMALRDISVLQYLMDFDLKNLCENIGYNEKIYDYEPITRQERPILEYLDTCTTQEELLDHLIWSYSNLGCGRFNMYEVYKLDQNNDVVGIKKPERTMLKDIIGYMKQKKEIKTNTEAFLNGNPCDNILLLGPTGMGKSSLIQAIANEYFEKGLKLIEVSKFQLSSLPNLVKKLENRGKCFVIYIDDLSFTHFEEQYQYLRFMLDGSIEARPSNVLIYATCNCSYAELDNWTDTSERHTPFCSDRDEEKIAITDKFRVNIAFNELSDTEYLEIVIELSKRHKLNVPEGFLKEQALNWKKNQKAVTGDTAKRFIHNIIWELKQE